MRNMVESFCAVKDVILKHDYRAALERPPGIRPTHSVVGQMGAEFTISDLGGPDKACEVIAAATQSGMVIARVPYTADHVRRIEKDGEDPVNVIPVAFFHRGNTAEIAPWLTEHPTAILRWQTVRRATDADRQDLTTDFAPAEKPAEQAIAFDYTDRDGNLLYQNVRLPITKPDGTPVMSDKGKPDKTFRQRRLENGRWIWGLGDIPKVPYRLPELIAAIQDDRTIPVLVLEGEAKVDLVLSWGMPATSLKGVKDYAEFFRDADVVLVPDNDAAGYEHINKLGSELSGIAEHVRVLTLPGLDKGHDVIDWHAAGGTAEQLLELIDVAPEWTPPAPRAAPGSPEPHGEASHTSSERGRRFALAALKGCSGELENIPEGDRNKRLNAIAFRLGRMVGAGWLDEFEVTRQLEQACARNGLMESDKPKQVRATIRSGLSKGRLQPHENLKTREWIDQYGEVHEEAYADSDAALNVGLLPLIWDSKEQLVLPECLVEDLLTEATIGYVAGESTAGKTFIAIYLAFCIGLGLDFFGKATKRGGVLYVVPEAPGTIPARMEAARMHLAYPLVFESGELTIEQANNLPIVRITAVPNLATGKGLAQLIATAKHVADEMPNRFGVPLRLVIIDTALAGFGIKDWNSPGDVAAVTNAMNGIRDATGAACLSIAHHGKDVAKGIAGSFAIKAGADTVLSVLVEFEDALSGVAKCRHVVLTKWRDGEAGWQSEFTLTKVKVGETPDDKPVFSAYVTPVKDGIKLAAPKKGKIGRPSTGGRPLKAFKDAFTECPLETVKMDGTGTDINAVRRDSVRKAFDARYTVDAETPKKADDARRKAFDRGLEAAVASWNVYEREWNGTAWLWRVVPDKKDKNGQK